MAEKEKKNKGQLYTEVEEYVNTTCKAFIAPHSDYIDIACKHKGSEGEAYIKLVDAADQAYYYNITDLNTEDICKLITKIIVGEHTPRMLTEYADRKEVAQIFR